MSETPHQKQDFIELAKRQFAQISAEFEKALDTLKDPERRRQLTSSYLDVLQKGLSRAQESVAKYQEKVATQPTEEPSIPAPAPEASDAAPPTGGISEAGNTRPPESTD
jgi:chromosome segregation ATPase